MIAPFCIHFDLQYEAFYHFARGARGMQLDSAVFVAMYNIRGHPACQRSSDLALMWVRDVAEKNPVVCDQEY